MSDETPSWRGPAPKYYKIGDYVRIADELTLRISGAFENGVAIAVECSGSYPFIWTIEGTNDWVKASKHGLRLNKDNSYIKQIEGKPLVFRRYTTAESAPEPSPSPNAPTAA